MLKDKNSTEHGHRPRWSDEIEELLIYLYWDGITAIRVHQRLFRTPYADMKSKFRLDRAPHWWNASNQAIQKRFIPLGDDYNVLDAT